MKSGTYQVAEVCPNGHLSTDAADQYPELREKVCSKCGEATMIACPACMTHIRGNYYVANVFGGSYEPPAYCYNCGNAFPWTARKIAGAVELLQVDGTLSDTEIGQAETDLTELTKDSPRTLAASLRFKKVLIKVGKSVGDGAREIIVSVASDAAKKLLLGG